MSYVVIRDLHKTYRCYYMFFWYSDDRLKMVSLSHYLAQVDVEKYNFTYYPGLTDATCGTVNDRWKNMQNIPPKNREVGMVFQSYALFPNMTVYENVAFGLKMKKKIQKRVKNK